MRIRIPASGLLEAIFEVCPDSDGAFTEGVIFRLDGEKKKIRVSSFCVRKGVLHREEMQASIPYALISPPRAPTHMATKLAQAHLTHLNK